MKIRLPVLAASLLLMGLSLYIFQLQSRQMMSDSLADSPTSPSSQQSSEEREMLKLQAAFEHARKYDFRAKSNNNSKRGGLSIEDLPVEVRAKAAEVAKQYKEGIYPFLKKYIAENNGELPLNASRFPEIEPYMEDTEYKGTGEKMMGRGSWYVGFSWRMDGTMIIRDVYSKNPSDGPHDPWAIYSGFDNYPSPGKGFRITGWDDGRVTFDSAEQCYHGFIKSGLKAGLPAMCPPGQAGISPDAIFSLKAWEKSWTKDTSVTK